MQRITAGDKVKVNGPYFGSKAIVREVHEDCYPVQVSFIITEPQNRPYVWEGEEGTVVIACVELA